MNVKTKPISVATVTREGGGGGGRGVTPVV